MIKKQPSVPRLLFALVLEACTTLGCGHVIMPGPSPIPHPGATCSSVCAHEFSLGCPAAQPTADGRTCVDVCENITLSGFTTLDLGCMDAAPTCAAVDQCSASVNN